MWSSRTRRQYWKPGVPLLRFATAGGEAAVEIIPESSKLNVNSASPEQLSLLFLAIGLDPPQAAALVSAILDWRVPPSGPSSPFDRIYLQASPSFRAPHASLEQIEELCRYRVSQQTFSTGATSDCRTAACATAGTA